MKKFIVLFLAFWFGRRVERYGPTVAEHLGRAAGKFVGDKTADILLADQGRVLFPPPEMKTIEFATREDANTAQDIFGVRCRAYGQITVANLYELCGCPPETYQYAESIYGWTNPSAFSVELIGIKRPVWVAKLPDPVNLYPTGRGRYS